MKAQNLTQQETQELNDFIVKCVKTNATFPSERIGSNRITVQQLLNEFNIDSLINFGDFIEKKLTANGSSFKSRKGVLKFGEINAADVVTNLHHIIKLKEFEEEEVQFERELKKIASDLENMQSPDEIKQKLFARKAELETLLGKQKQ